ncbi:hypothetical protein MAHJHV45_14000 [Mycobacterium avium subsp. hominissuis]
MYRVGQKILPQQARKGDLIFYGPEGTQSVAMYLGNNQMLEVGDVVQVSPVRTAGMAPYMVRVLGTTAPTQQVPQQAPLQQTPAQQAPLQQTPGQQAPTQQAPLQQVPGQQLPTQQAPQQAPLQLAPTQQAPLQQLPTQQSPLQQLPVQQSPLQPAGAGLTR